MTKKHFKAFAEAISKVSNLDERKKLEDFIGRLCANENHLFDWNRWHQACNGLPFKK